MKNESENIIMYDNGDNSDCLDGLLYQKVSKVSSIRLIDISMSREFPTNLIKFCYRQSSNCL